MTMKPSKHIERLAHKLAIKDEKENTYPMNAGRYIEELQAIKDALLAGNFWMRVDSVSKSGMSRKIVMAYMKNNRPVKIWNKQILQLACCDKDGRIGGCGMDMLFHAQYSLFHALHRSYKEARYQKRMKSYNYLP